MNKYIRFFAAAAFIVSAALIVSSCNEDEDKEFTVTFDLNYAGSSGAPPAATVVEGKTVAKPAANPTRTGFTFVGWFKEAAGTNEYDFAAPVTADITLYAKWSQLFVVTFISNEGSTVDAISDVASGATINAPTPPTRAGHTFGGWFKEEALTTAWDFATDVVTGNVTLYAKWNANTYTVTFNSDGGSAVEPETVAHGEKATKPADPTKAGQDFGGWFKEAALTTAWNFATDVVTAATTLYARWRVAVSVTVSTIAGTGAAGFADGVGEEAQFNFPSGIAFDAAGNLYVADGQNHRIRKVTPAGVVSTIAGSTQGFADGAGSEAQFAVPRGGIAFDAAGNLYVADLGNHRIRKITPEGMVSTFADDLPGDPMGLYHPSGIAIDVAGNLYVTSDSRILKITPAGEVSIFAGRTSDAGFTNGVGGSARFYFPDGIAIDAAGNLYVADTWNNRIRKVTPEGVVSTVAGGAQGFVDGAAAEARFNRPEGIAIDAAGNLYVADTNNNRIRKITPEGVVSTIAGSTSGFADGAGTAARFSRPSRIAIDAAGNLYVTDQSNHRIRKIVFE